MSRPTRSRRIVVALVSCTALAGVPAVTAAATPAPSSGANGHSAVHRHLKILVTNDDGWFGSGGSSTPYIVALRTALLAAGESVVVVAPNHDASGTGSGGTFTGSPLTVSNPEPDVYTASGTPTDSVFLALDGLLAKVKPGWKPDLVIAGINPGGNYSSLLDQSGTVGGATAALQTRVPGIAVSMDGTASSYPLFAENTATYVVRVVRMLEADGQRRLLPAGVGLNINYPAHTTTRNGVVQKLAVKGTDVTYIDPASYLNFAYQQTSPGSGSYQLGVTPTNVPASSGSDRDALQHQYISVTPITADRTVVSRSGGAWSALVRALRRI